MLDKIKLEHILFLDIETVPQEELFDQMDPELQVLWKQKTQYQRKEDYSPEEFYDRAGIWAEFGKIVCISVGYFQIKGDIRNFRVTSFFGDEVELLKAFNNLLNNHFSGPQFVLCGHNIKEFDIPFIARRMIVNRISLSGKLNLFGKKPWEIPHLDTMELWKFGDFKNFTSLNLLAHLFDIPTPKDDIDGSMVASIYYVEKDLPRIVKYCEKDVLTLANVFRKLRQEELLKRFND